MTKYSWNQPICERCWINKNSEIIWKRGYIIESYVTIRLPVMVRYEEETNIIKQCAYCGKPTFIGAFIRDNPEKVPYPRAKNEDD